jgi:hypothetical protein
MTKQLKLAIIISVLLLWIFGLCLYAAANKIDDSDSKQIADYEYQMNELRKAKEKCFDDLTYKESQDSIDWLTKPCVQYDEEIMSLREKADALKAKSYEGLR